MGFIEKIIAIVMIPLAILIFLGFFDIFSLDLGFDIVLLGALIMIFLQLWSLLQSKFINKHIRIIDYIRVFVFIIPALLYFLIFFVMIPFQEFIPLILGLMMFIEALYALH